MSKRWGIDTEDIHSTLRHTFIPLASGAVVASLEAVQSGGFSPATMKAAAITSLLSGVIGFLKRWTANSEL